MGNWRVGLIDKHANDATPFRRNSESARSLYASRLRQITEGNNNYIRFHVDSFYANEQSRKQDLVNKILEGVIKIQIFISHGLTEEENEQ